LQRSLISRMASQNHDMRSAMDLLVIPEVILTEVTDIEDISLTES
jgi:hypothetical protein